MPDDSNPLPEMFVIDDSTPFTADDAHERGRTEGETSAYRHALRRVLELRFGRLLEPHASMIERELDVGRLAAWHADAVTAARLDDVFA